MNPIAPRLDHSRVKSSTSRVPLVRAGFALLGFFALAGLSGSFLQAAEKSGQKSAKKSAQKARDPFTRWDSLFNGKDLSGWVQVGKEKWVVEDGVIHGQGMSDQYGYLRTEKKYADFHLALKFKCEDDGNSGVYFRTDFEPGTVKLSQGLQVEIDRRLGFHSGGIHGVGRSWVAWPSAENESVIRPYEWNELLIKIEGNRYWVRMNGVVVMDFTDPNPLSLDGYISLQLHSGGLGNMKFKDIAIRDLSIR